MLSWLKGPVAAGLATGRRAIDIDIDGEGAGS
jgi:hypothetical protein